MDELPGRSNYFIGKDPAKWRTSVRNYAEVKYKSVYPGVDLVYHGNQGLLEYDFVVQPGADAGAIRLDVGAGLAPPGRAPQAAPLRIARNGDLIVEVGGGEVRFHKPIIYQPGATPSASLSSLIEGRFIVEGRNQIGFRVGHYDHRLPLVIDPTLTYSTYLGGSQGDAGYGIAVDSSGDAYIAGQTCSTDFPTATPEQPANAGGCDAFVTELNPAGTALIYSTYLGGSGGDGASGIAVDSTGAAYVVGSTNSTDFPTTAGAFQHTYGGGDTDAFVTKLATGGGSLVYSTYLGGNGSENGAAIALDSSDDAVATGQTCSANFPLHKALPQDFVNLINVGAECDAFVTELNPAGTGLVFSTYLGGSLADAAFGVAVDSQGSAFVAGGTDSGDFPVQDPIQGGYGGTPAPPAPAFPGDAFVTKLATGGGSLVYSTYLGGAEGETATGIAVDNLGNAYVAGWTTSGNFPVTSGALQSALAGTTDAFVSKLNPLGSALLYSTYLGGNGVSEALAVAVDINGLAYVTGGTASPDFPTVGALEPALAGPTVFPGDAFVSKLDTSGSGLIYSSYLGGGDLDQGNGIALDNGSAPDDNGAAAVYITGSTQSIDFPTTAGAFQTTCGTDTKCNGEQPDAFVTKLTSLTAPLATIVTPQGSKTLLFGAEGVGIPTDCLVPTVVPPNLPITCPPADVATVTVTNSGDAALTVTQLAEVGGFSNPTPPAPPVDLQEWSVANDNCTGVTVQTGSSCTFTLSFNPQLTGARNGTVTITDNAISSTQVVNLSGEGVMPPAVAITPLALTFSPQLSATTSAAQSVSLTNSGGFPLAISSIVISGGFAQTNNCGGSLGPGLTCTLNVTFSPATTGSLTGTIVITDDASGSPQMVSLAGTGIAPLATLTANSITFPDQAVNTTSALQSVTLANTGTATLNITSITLGGTNSADFAITDTCGASLQTGAGCAINVTFTPKAAGPRVASISIADNAGGSPQMVSLTGTGINLPVASLSPLTLTFPAQKQGTTSAPLSLTLTNTGTAPLIITGIAPSSGFAETSTCPASLAPAANCTISVTFTPPAPGAVNGAIIVTDNASDSPQTIPLVGTGQAAPVVSLSAATLNFGGEAVGTPSSAQTLTISNAGSAALNVASISISGTSAGDFSETNTCAVPVVAGSSCNVSVTFTPTAAGIRAGILTVADNAPNSPQSVALGGIGADFSLAVAPPSTVVLAGNAANYTVTLTPQNGFNGTVTFSCSNLPPLSSCSASPASLTENGSSALTAMVTVNTTVRSLAPPRQGPGIGWRPLGGHVLPPWLLWMFVLFSLSIFGLARRARALPSVVAVLALALLVATWAACSGTPSAPSGTPAGTYTLSIIGASGPVSHAVTVTLQVQ